MGSGSSKVSKYDLKKVDISHVEGHNLLTEFEQAMIKAWTKYGDITGKLHLHKFPRIEKLLDDWMGTKTDFPHKVVPPAQRPKPTTAINIPGFQGDLYNDGYSLYRAADDFGHALHEFPALVARPDRNNTFDQHAQSVAAVVKYARAATPKIKVVCRGADIFDEVKTAHSTFGQSLRQGGIVIETSTISNIEFQGDYVTVGCGLTWKTVLDACQKQSCCVPITTSNLFLTVGGTLSVLCAEYATTTQGAAVDYIESMVVVTGTGDIVTCTKESTGSEKELFDAVRCGLGEYGVMVSVTFKVMRDLPKVCSYQLGYLAKEDAMAAMEKLNHNSKVTGCFIEVLSHMEIMYPIGTSILAQFEVAPWLQLLARIPSVLSHIPSDMKSESVKFIYFVNSVCYEYDGQHVDPEKDILPGLPTPDQTWTSHMEFFDYKASVDPYLALDMHYGSWNGPHTQLSTFVPFSKASAILDKVLALYDSAEYTKAVLYFDIAPYRQGCIKAPGFMLPKLEPGEDFVLLSTMASDRNKIEQGGDCAYQHYAELLRMIKDLAKEMWAIAPDAKTFPWGFIPYSWKEHYGDKYETQLAYKQQFDPDFILGGCGVFEGTSIS